MTSRESETEARAGATPAPDAATEEATTTGDAAAEEVVTGDATTTAAEEATTAATTTPAASVSAGSVESVAGAAATPETLAGATATPATVQPTGNLALAARDAAMPPEEGARIGSALETIKTAAVWLVVIQILTILSPLLPVSLKWSLIVGVLLTLSSFAIAALAYLKAQRAQRGLPE